MSHHLIIFPCVIVANGGDEELYPRHQAIIKVMKARTKNLFAKLGQEHVLILGAFYVSVRIRAPLPDFASFRSHSLISTREESSMWSFMRRKREKSNQLLLNLRSVET